jgi:hypothetical protein
MLQYFGLTFVIIVKQVVPLNVFFGSFEAPHDVAHFHLLGGKIFNLDRQSDTY